MIGVGWCASTEFKAQGRMLEESEVPVWEGSMINGGFWQDDLYAEIPLMQALFEAASAIGTVGLSLGATAEASEASRLILIFLMYFGRVGGLTMIYAMAASSNGASSQYPQEQVTVG